MAEPLAVALHAARRAGSLMGSRVLVSGSGPIGALTAIAARRAGARKSSSPTSPTERYLLRPASAPIA